MRVEIFVSCWPVRCYCCKESGQGQGLIQFSQPRPAPAMGCMQTIRPGLCYRVIITIPRSRGIGRGGVGTSWVLALCWTVGYKPCRTHMSRPQPSLPCFVALCCPSLLQCSCPPIHPSIHPHPITRAVGQDRAQARPGRYYYYQPWPRSVYPSLLPLQQQHQDQFQTRIFAKESHLLSQYDNRASSASLPSSSQAIHPLHRFFIRSDQRTSSPAPGTKGKVTQTLGP